MDQKEEKRIFPPYRSMNLAICSSVLDRYLDSRDLKHSYEQYGLNGLEVIRTGEPDQGKICPEMVTGVHLFFQVFWMDWWKGKTRWLDAEFDSRQQWIEYFGSENREGYLDRLRADLEYADAVGAKYVVFHASEVDLLESFTWNYKYSDEEVVDACIEIINLLLDGRHYTFDFLVENLWWSGMTLKDAALTRRMLEGIHYAHKGVMLDTGHFMNTNYELKTPGEALVYLHEMLDSHEKEGLLPYFKGMHLQLSLGGAYVRQQRKAWEQDRKIVCPSGECYSEQQFLKLPFYERFRLAYEHVGQIDRHQPFAAEGVARLVKRVSPVYLTFEFQQQSREEYEQFLCVQSRFLRCFCLEKEVPDYDSLIMAV